MRIAVNLLSSVEFAAGTETFSQTAHNRYEAIPSKRPSLLSKSCGWKDVNEATTF